MIEYKLIWMGPVVPMEGSWAAGRIEIQHDDYITELSVPLMDLDAWYELGIMLSCLETQHRLNQQEIFSRLERMLGRPIRWYKENK